MSRKLQSQLGAEGASGTVDYVVRFSSAAEATDNRRVVEELGGTVHAIGDEGTLQRVVIAKDQLADVRVSDQTLATVNTKVRVNRPATANADLEDLSDDQAILEALTVRKVTGVDRLLQRFPQADGRGVKVAVFDTGIDFGVEGVSQGGKLAGFYDLTGFGRVAMTALVSDVPQPSYTIDGRALAIPASLGVSRILSTGSLSEANLAAAYDMASGVDLDGNAQITDVFPFVIAQSRTGSLAAFIDLNGDGTIAIDGTEELTDYNTTYKWLDLYHGAPAGARPLAITITDATNVQFHSVPAGHGTSCAVIIAGDGYADGRLTGLAPKATLYSYLLDADGQDFYTVDQFLAMFLHAKAQGVDAISISWGFSTADLESSRFVAEFLDRDIASAGIVIAIAAGNAGPGILSAAADDYIPRHGFGVAAMVSAEQGTNVYGWTGTVDDAIVGYSSVGPTRGGRLIPDAASPLISFVRGQRGTASGPFYGFSGTSSATPALIGSVSALVSALKQNGETSIDARLLKLAVQGTAKPLIATDGLREGAGVIDVAAAYDKYVTLVAEMRAARADASRRTKFAYELRADTPLQGQTLTGEGVISRGLPEDATVAVSIVGESATLIDPTTTLEPLLVRHSGNFFTTQDVLPLQATVARFILRFDAQALRTPGVYMDVIELVRASDGLTLLRVPVAVTIDSPASLEGKLAVVDETMTPFQVWRMPVTLTAKDEIAFDGVAVDLGGNASHSLALQVYDAAGNSVAYKSTSLDGPVGVINLRSGQLPAGRYELLINRSFSRPAALGDLKLTGAFRLAKTQVLAATADASGVSVAITARGRFDAKRAELEVYGASQGLTLGRGIGSLGREGYLATVDLGTPTSAIELNLRQKSFDRLLEDFLHVEVVIRDSDTGTPLYRGWYNLKSEHDLADAIALEAPASKIDILAYPNIVNWSSIQTQSLVADLSVPLATPIVLASQPLTTGGTGTRTMALRFNGVAPGNSSARLKFYDAAGVLLETHSLAIGR